MGQKTNPIGLRIAVNKDWRSKWYADKRDFGKLLAEDRKIREMLKRKLESASVPRILIERAATRCRITILTARPGVVIGRKGAEIDKLKEELSKMTGKEIYVDILEIKQPEIDAQLVAENVALQLERRVSFRRAMKKAIQTAMDFGAEGIKIRCAGRLGGAELARVETYHEGRVPLHTLRANIDYGFAETPFGEAIIAETKRGICHLSFVNGHGRNSARDLLTSQWPNAKLRRNDARIAELSAAIFTQGRDGTSRRPLRAFVRGTPFQLRVWRALLQVPSGTLTTYGRLAQAIGQSKAARAVGSAVGANPVCWISASWVLRQLSFVSGGLPLLSWISR